MAGRYLLAVAKGEQGAGAVVFVAMFEMISKSGFVMAVIHILPDGVKGALYVILLMGVFGGDGTHLLSWGSIFIQDVVPFAGNR